MTEMIDSVGQQSGQTIRLGGRLFSVKLLGKDAVGTTSAIYEAYDLNNADAKPLILKSFMEESTYKIEVKVLRNVEAHDNGDLGQHFPRVIASGEQYFRGNYGYLLLMQFAEGTPVESSIPLPEKEALLVIAHYLDCMISLARSGFTCWDRKLKDFFWTPASSTADNGKLMVIDWNMAQEWSPALMGNDLVSAGRFLYELLTGIPALLRPGSIFYDLEQTNHLTHSSAREVTPWKRISFGTQRLVTTLLHESHRMYLPASKKPLDEQKNNMLLEVENLREKCLKLWNLWGESQAYLRSEAGEFLEKDVEANQKLALDKQALEYISIVALKHKDKNRGWMDYTYPTIDEEDIRDKARERVLPQIDPLKEAKRNLAEGNAEVAVVEIEKLLAGKLHLSPKNELAVARWFIIAHKWSSLKNSGKDYVERLDRTFEILEKQLGEELVSETVVQENIKLLQQIDTALYDEFDVRFKAKAGDLAYQNREYSNAEKHFNNALDLLEKKYSDYAGRLKALLQSAMSNLEPQRNNANQQVRLHDRPSAISEKVDAIVKAKKFSDALTELDCARRESIFDKQLDQRGDYIRKLVYLHHLFALTKASVKDGKTNHTTNLEAITDATEYAYYLLNESEENGLLPQYTEPVKDILQHIHKDYFEWFKFLGLDNPDLLKALGQLPILYKDNEAEKVPYYQDLSKKIDTLLKQLYETVGKLPNTRARSFKKWKVLAESAANIPQLTQTLLSLNSPTPPLTDFASANEKLQKHWEAIMAIDNLATQLDGLPKEHKKEFLELADKAGLSLTSQGIDIFARLSEFQHNEQEDKAAELSHEIALVATSLRPSETVYLEPSYLNALHEAHLELNKLDYDYHTIPESDQAKAIENLNTWIKGAQKGLAGILHQATQIRNSYQLLITQEAVSVESALETVQARFSENNSNLQAVGKRWLNELHSPLTLELDRAYSTDAETFWKERTIALEKVARELLNTYMAKKDPDWIRERFLILELALIECQKHSTSANIDLKGLIKDLNDAWQGQVEEIARNDNLSEMIKQVRDQLNDDATRYRDNGQAMKALNVKIAALSLGVMGDMGRNLFDKELQDTIKDIANNEATQGIIDYALSRMKAELKAEIIAEIGSSPSPTPLPTDTLNRIEARIKDTEGYIKRIWDSIPNRVKTEPFARAAEQARIDISPDADQRGSPWGLEEIVSLIWLLFTYPVGDWEPYQAMIKKQVQRFGSRSLPGEKRKDRREQAISLYHFVAAILDIKQPVDMKQSGGGR